ncbi:hypothetical protein, partial [Staphylococcus aureus]|uniref:hypothetical protein n=1 Tax=Staphylococcus aureus TaxID=1280 RepID=UPI001CEF8C7C
STLGFIDINKAPFKVFIFSMSTLKGAFQSLTPQSFFLIDWGIIMALALLLSLLKISCIFSL